MFLQYINIVFKNAYFAYNKMKKKKQYQTFRTVPKSNGKITETGKFETPNTHIHDRGLS
jgi:hypothetical protein